MSPYQHGEVFVTDDGAETDLDLGHYERFVDEALERATLPSPPARSTGASSTGSGRAATSAARCRSSPTSPTRSRTASTPWSDDQTVRCRHHGNRRHRRRHREPALPRSHPAGGRRRRDDENCPLHPRAAHRLHPRLRRAQEQAHAAFRQGAALRSASSRISSSAARTAPLPEDMPPEDRAVLQRRAGMRDPEPSRPRRSMRCRCCLRTRASAAVVCRKLGLDGDEPDLQEWTALVEQDQARAQAGEHRPRRQVYPVCTTLISASWKSLFHGGHGKRRAGGQSNGSTPRR